MEEVKRFLKRNIDNIILVIMCIPGCWWISQIGSYNSALAKCSNGLASMCMFFIILLSAVLVFSSFSYKIKRTITGFIICAVVTLLIIVPIVGIYVMIDGEKIETLQGWGSGKLSMMIQFISLEVVALAGLVGQFFRIDRTKRDLD